MSTIQSIFEAYNTLPKRDRNKLKKLINDDSEMIQIDVKGLKQGLKEVRMMMDGLLPETTFEDLKREMANEK